LGIGRNPGSGDERDHEKDESREERVVHVEVVKAK
jgi:hypothetical protein